MKPWIKGLLVAAVQVSLVASLGLKLLYDRANRPRVWVLTAPYDPSLPIRGRYVSLQLVVEPGDIREKQPDWFREPGTAVILRVEGDHLVAEKPPPAVGMVPPPCACISSARPRPDGRCWTNRWPFSFQNTSPTRPGSSPARNCGWKQPFPRTALPAPSAWV